MASAITLVDVLLSFSWKDKSIVLPIAEALKAAGLRVLMNNMDPGALPRELLKERRNEKRSSCPYAKLAIVCLSENYEEDRDCTDECGDIIDRNFTEEPVALFFCGRPDYQPGKVSWLSRKLVEKLVEQPTAPVVIHGKAASTNAIKMREVVDTIKKMMQSHWSIVQPPWNLGDSGMPACDKDFLLRRQPIDICTSRSDSTVTAASAGSGAAAMALLPSPAASGRRPAEAVRKDPICPPRYEVHDVVIYTRTPALSSSARGSSPSTASSTAANDAAAAAAVPVGWSFRYRLRLSAGEIPNDRAKSTISGPEQYDSKLQNGVYALGQQMTIGQWSESRLEFGQDQYLAGVSIGYGPCGYARKSSARDGAVSLGSSARLEATKGVCHLQLIRSDGLVLSIGNDTGVTEVLGWPASNESSPDQRIFGFSGHVSSVIDDLVPLCWARDDTSSSSIDMQMAILTRSGRIVQSHNDSRGGAWARAFDRLARRHSIGIADQGTAAAIILQSLTRGHLVRSELYKKRLSDNTKSNSRHQFTRDHGRRSRREYDAKRKYEIMPLPHVPAEKQQPTSGDLAAMFGATGINIPTKQQWAESNTADKHIDFSQSTKLSDWHDVTLVPRGYRIDESEDEHAAEKLRVAWEKRQRDKAEYLRKQQLLRQQQQQQSDWLTNSYGPSSSTTAAPWQSASMGRSPKNVGSSSGSTLSAVKSTTAGSGAPHSCGTSSTSLYSAAPIVPSPSASSSSLGSRRSSGGASSFLQGAAARLMSTLSSGGKADGSGGKADGSGGGDRGGRGSRPSRGDRSNSQNGDVELTSQSPRNIGFSDVVDQVIQLQVQGSNKPVARTTISELCACGITADGDVGDDAGRQAPVGTPKHMSTSSSAAGTGTLQHLSRMSSRDRDRTSTSSGADGSPSTPSTPGSAMAGMHNRLGGTIGGGNALRAAMQRKYDDDEDEDGAGANAPPSRQDSRHSRGSQGSAGSSDGRQKKQGLATFMDDDGGEA